jgi:hypothetical protein
MRGLGFEPDPDGHPDIGTIELSGVVSNREKAAF